MLNEDIIKDLKRISGEEILRNIPLKEYTTWKIGGPADYLLIINNNQVLITVYKYCLKKEIPLTIIGKGSNVLISDEGIRGLVLINESKSIDINRRFKVKTSKKSSNLINPRIVESEFNYSENPIEKVEVVISSGTILSYAINFLIDKGITGLQWFAGIPGTIGGATYNNIHGGTHFISEYIKSVEVINEKGKLINLSNEQLDFDYDQSIFHKRKYLILNITFELNIGDKEKALKTAIAWTKKKLENQVFNSAGCCFKNLSDFEKQKFNIPSNSWGYIIDNILKIKGQRIGGAQISNKHAAFIENISEASAKDVLSLFDLIYEKSEALIHIKPKTEIVFLGFNESVIQKYL